MRVAAETDVTAPRAAVWDYIVDPENYLHFMVGVTRWQVVSEQDRGLGARYQTLMRVRSAEVGGLVEVVEYDEPADLAWTSVTGIDQRGRWRLRRVAGKSITHVEFRLSYGVAGAGIGGWLAEHIAAPTVSDNLRRSLNQLKRHVEHEQMRADAAARRGAAHR